MDDNLELYKKLRPTKFNQIFGQEDTVRVLQAMVEKNNVPRTLHGPLRRRLRYETQ